MDPTHFLAARPDRQSRSTVEIEAFYQQHGWDAFFVARAVRRIAARLRAPAQDRRAFVVRRPAE